MSRAKELASALGMFTADKLDERRRTRGETKVQPHELLRSHWTKAKRDVFEWCGAASMTVVVDDLISLTTYNPDGSVKRRFGHNGGFRAARFIKTASWDDRAAAAWSKHAGYNSRAEFRLWCADVDSRDKMLDAVLSLVVSRAEARAHERDLRPGYYDLGAEIDLQLFAYECRCLATDLGIATRDDVEFSIWLDKVTSAAQALCDELRHNAVNEKHINAVLRRNAERGNT